MAKTRTFRARVMGINYANADGTSRQEIAARCQLGEQLTLELEPDNPQDPDAVAVLRSNGQQLGYIPRDRAKNIARRLRARLPCAAKVFDLAPGDRGYLQVTIQVDLPDFPRPQISEQGTFDFSDDS